METTIGVLSKHGRVTNRAEAQKQGVAAAFVKFVWFLFWTAVYFASLIGPFVVVNEWQARLVLIAIVFATGRTWYSRHLGVAIIVTFIEMTLLAAVCFQWNLWRIFFI